MHKTRHFQERMNQRGINQQMVDLVMNYGQTEGDRTFISRKGAEKLMEDFRTLMKILDKGGLVVVTSGDAQLTAYNYQGRSH
ncbi:MAG: DUF4258 domain-containing protein [Pseudoxanthomonas sp.]